MKKWSLGYLLIFTLFIAACEKDADNSPDPVDEVVSNKQKATELLLSFTTGDTSKALQYIDPNTYTQHNPSLADGRDAFVGAMLAGQFDNISINIVRTIVDDDVVALHSEYTVNGTAMVGFDVFRFKEGLIVEHWDNLQATEPVNPSGHTMMDGPTEVENTSETELNRSVVDNFIQTVMIDTNYALMPDFFNDGAYIQHNPLMKDSLSGMTEMMDELASQGIIYQYDKLHQTVAQGNFVLTLSEGSFGDPAQPTAFYDLFRVEAGKIVEHWDVRQVIPPSEEWANSNGKF